MMGPEARWTRRGFLATTGATAGSIALGLAGCSDDANNDGNDGAKNDSDNDGDGANGQDGDDRGAGSSSADRADRAAGEVPDEATIFGWIEEIVDQGIRRPGSPADVWTEEFCAEHFRRLGLEDVRLEPVELTRWDPGEWSLQVTPEGGDPVEIACFPMPNGPPVQDLEAELARFDPADPGRVAGKVSLYDVSLLAVPADTFLAAGSAPADTTGRAVDPGGTLGDPHLLPTGAELGLVQDPSIAAGAVAFVGSLKNYPGNSYQYYNGVPPQAENLLPGVWISGSDGDWLAQQLDRGSVRVRLNIDSVAEPFVSHNVVGELPGADDEVVMIGSHHDGPWASAVEDASGTALVLALADYWAAQPVEQRPHRLVFLLHAGHMAAAAGHARYIEDHRDELADVVLQIHLEQAALEAEEQADGTVVATGRPVPRWFFTSRIPALEAAVIDALETEELHRSMVLAPDAIGDQPPSDGAFYYHEGVPIMHFLTAPFYLFDAMDTLDKVDRDSLVPLARATISIVESTRGVTAVAMRAADETR